MSYFCNCLFSCSNSAIFVCIAFNGFVLYEFDDYEKQSMWFCEHYDAYVVVKSSSKPAGFVFIIGYTLSDQMRCYAVKHLAD